MYTDQAKSWTFEHTRPQIAVVCHFIACSITNAASTHPYPDRVLGDWFAAAVNALKAATDGRPTIRRADEVALAALAGQMQDVTLLRCQCESPPEVVAEVSDALTAIGLDGEALVWAVVSFEAQNHIKLIWYEAHKLTKRNPDRTPEDMFGWGWLGLRTALRAYDPSLGFRFATYACQRISGAIRDGLRSEQPVPKRLTTFARKVSRTEENLVGELGRIPTLDEVSQRLLAKVETLRVLPRLSPTVSLDELRSEQGSPPREWVVDELDPADVALLDIRDAEVRAAVSALNPEEASVIKMMYFEGLSVPQISDLMGISPRQVRSRMARARDQLTEPLASWV